MKYENVNQRAETTPWPSSHNSSVHSNILSILNGVEKNDRISKDLLKQSAHFLHNEAVVNNIEASNLGINNTSIQSHIHHVLAALPKSKQLCIHIPRFRSRLVVSCIQCIPQRACACIDMIVYTIKRVNVVDSLSGESGSVGF